MLLWAGGGLGRAGLQCRTQFVMPHTRPLVSLSLPLWLWLSCASKCQGNFCLHRRCFQLVFLSSSYDHEGRLTNVTRPTGVVTSLHREMEKSITIDIENSNRDDDVTVITNLSSVEASYTVVQGKAAPPPASPPSLAAAPEPATPHSRELLGIQNIPQLSVLLRCLQKTHSTRKHPPVKNKIK